MTTSNRLVKRILVFASLVLVACFAPQCKKEQQGVPYVYVNLVVYVNDPQNIELQTIGGWKYFSGGYRGLLVFRKSQSEFMIYDRACPVHSEEPTAVVSVDSSNILLNCPVCNSQFLLSDGSTTAGPAIIPLTHYPYVYDGTVLEVRN